MTSLDHSISTSIKSEIIKQMPDSSKDIHVETREGSVILKGAVNVLYEKLKCEEIAKKVDGVIKVENDITITLDGSASDKELTELLNKNLRSEDHKTDFIGVTGKVNGGSAILVGETDTEALRKAALVEASRTYGIKDVVNNISVTGHSEDINLSNKIFEELTKNNIDTSDMTHTVARNEVTLNGYARNEEDIKRIVDIIENIKSIKHVKNKLKPRPWKTGIRD